MAKFKGFGKAPNDKNSTAKAISEAFTIALDHYQAGRLAQAEQICRQILQWQPKQLEALHWLGSIAYQTGRIEEAYSYCRKALALEPNNLEVLSNLGNMLQEMGKQEEAIFNFQKALALDANYALAHHGLGVTFIQQGKLEPAVTHLRQAIALNPNDAKAYCSLGVAVQEQGLLEEALSIYQKAIQLQPEIPETHINRGQILLLLGDFHNGFAELEWRWQSKDWGTSRLFSQPLWDGTTLKGKTILLHAEQGLGDTIQFIRYAPLVAACGGRVVVECPAALRSLLSTVIGIEQLVVHGEPLPEFQVHSPLLSLPHILGTTLETIPAQIPYLFPPASQHLKLETLPDTIKVGIVWASGYRTPNFLRDYQRKSCPLSSYAQLFSIPGMSVYSLQVGSHAADIAQLEEEHRLQDLSPQIKDFADTAALVAQMDLVISVDTAVAHLAGAMGKPVWLLLSFSHDWRWLLEREDSSWYPSMRLFRQSQPGDWERVIEQVAQALTCFCQEVQAQQQSQFEALYQLGVIAYQSDRLEEAVCYLQKAVALNSDKAEVLSNLGSVLQGMGEQEAAILNFQKALALDPNYAFAHHGLGVSFLQQGKLEQAVTHLRQAIALNPGDAQAYCSLGVALWEQGLFEEVLSIYQKAIQLQPEIPEAHINLGYMLLLLGDFRNGFAEFEWRWQSKDREGLRPFTQPLWDGSNLEGKTILLHAEQGLGDTLQFIRYVPLVAARGGRVVVECPPSLRHLLSTVVGIEQLVVRGETLPEFQVHSSLLSLPHILGTTLETIPAQIPYLFSPAFYKPRLVLARSTNFKVGIVWASGYREGNHNFLKDHLQKSCPLSRYTRLLSIPEMSFYSLQVGRNAAEIAHLEGEHQLQDLSPQIKDFADTAALVAQMDLVISVDTAVAHLAGAMGKPVWLLLSFSHDWRWLLEREDSPWYPTMRLFRQSQPGDWEEVLEQVAQALSRFHQECRYPGGAQQKNKNLSPPASLAYFQNSEQSAASSGGNQFETLHHLGVIAYQLGNLKEATAYFQQAVALNPDDPQAQNNLSIVLMEQGKLAEAAIHLHQLIALTPNDVMAHINLGNVLREQGEPKAAILHFQMALALNSSNAYAYNGLGITLGSQNQWEEAITYLRQAVNFNPDYADAHNNLGLVLQEVGKLEAAASHYQKAIALQPDNPITYTNLGNLLHEQGQLEAAILNFQKALALNPNDTDACYSLGAVLQELGNINK